MSILFNWSSESSLFVLDEASSRRSYKVAFELRTSIRDCFTAVFGSLTEIWIDELLGLVWSYSWWAWISYELK